VWRDELEVDVALAVDPSVAILGVVDVALEVDPSVAILGVVDVDPSVAILGVVAVDPSVAILDAGRTVWGLAELCPSGGKSFQEENPVVWGSITRFGLVKLAKKSFISLAKCGKG
jgi:hypothetical protein